MRRSAATSRAATPWVTASMVSRSWKPASTARWQRTDLWWRAMPGARPCRIWIRQRVRRRGWQCRDGRSVPARCARPGWCGPVEGGRGRPHRCATSPDRETHAARGSQCYGAHETRVARTVRGKHRPRFDAWSTRAVRAGGTRRRTTGIATCRRSPAEHRIGPSADVSTYGVATRTTFASPARRAVAAVRTRVTMTDPDGGRTKPDRSKTVTGRAGSGCRRSPTWSVSFNRMPRSRFG